MRHFGTFTLSPKAKNDFQEIYDFVAFHNVKAAEKIIDAFRERFQMLSIFPDMGYKKNAVNRAFRMDDYLIIYRKKRGHIEISRILHSARKQSH